MLKILLTLFLICISSTAQATAIVYGGSGGNWSAGGTWVGGVAPTSADTVTVTGTGTITVDCVTPSTSCAAQSVDFTGFTGTLTHASSRQLTIGGSSAGAFTLVSGMTYTPASSSTLKFVGTATGNNITTAAKRLCPCVFDGVGGGWQFQDAFNPQAGIVGITLTNGALDTNGKAVAASNGTSFSSNNSNTRSLTLGATTWTLDGTATPNWDITTSTGMTVSGASSTITEVGLNSSSETFAGGGGTYGTFTANQLQGSTVLTILGNNTFTNLTLANNGAFTNGLNGVYLGSNQTVTGTLTLTGNSIINRMFVRSDTLGVARTITAAVGAAITNTDFQDITGAGAFSWNLSAVTGGSGNCTGNSGITFTSATNEYWVPSGATSTGSESATTRWSTSSGGTAGTGRSPLCQDTAIFDANSIDAGSRTITQDNFRFGAHNWTGATNSPTWAHSLAASFVGDITLAPNIGSSGVGSYTFVASDNHNLSMDGTTWTNVLVVNSAGTLTFTSGFKGLQITGTAGTVNSNTGSAFTLSSLSITGATVNLGGNVSLTGTGNVTGGSLIGPLYTMSGGTSCTVSGVATVNVKGYNCSTTYTQSGASNATFGSSGLVVGTTATKAGSGTLTLNGPSTIASTFGHSAGTVAVNSTFGVTGTYTPSATSNLQMGPSATATFTTGTVTGAASSGGSGGSYTFMQ